MTDFIDTKLLHQFSKFSIYSNDVKGRHVVANTRYKKGDVIIIEEPYAMVINGPYRYIIHDDFYR